MGGKKHSKSVGELKGEHKRSSSSAGTGGACLERHVSGIDENNSCCHRWQAYLQAKATSSIYDWPAYKSLSGGSSVRTSAGTKNGKVIPSWYKKSLPSPSEGDWDVKGDNFKKKCYLPYWHNAHHLVPNAELRGAIDTVGKGMARPGEIRLQVRQGLLKVKYNLNFKINMMILPMDRAIGRALTLPIHLKTTTSRSHAAYSKKVRTELDDIFSNVKSEIEPCEEGKEPDYQTCKDDIESLSKSLHRGVKSAGSAGVRNLDSIKSASLKG